MTILATIPGWGRNRRGERVTCAACGRRINRGERAVMHEAGTNVYFLDVHCERVKSMRFSARQ